MACGGQRAAPKFDALDTRHCAFHLCQPSFKQRDTGNRLRAQGRDTGGERNARNMQLTSSLGCDRCGEKASSQA